MTASRLAAERPPAPALARQSATLCAPFHPPAPQPEPLFLRLFRFGPVLLAGVIEHTRPTLRNQGPGEILTADGRASGHERDGAGLCLGAAAQASVADPAAKGIPGQLRTRPARSVPRTAGGGLSKPSILSSFSRVGQRMAVSFGVEFPHGLVASAVEVIRTVERLMGEVMSLQVAPENLDVVQLRRVFR